MALFVILFLVFGVIMHFQAKSIQKMADEADDEALKAGYLAGAKQRRIYSRIGLVMATIFGSFLLYMLMVF